MIFTYRKLWREAEAARREAEEARRRADEGVRDMAFACIQLLDKIGVPDHPSPEVRGMYRQLVSISNTATARAQDDSSKQKQGTHDAR